MADRMPIPSHPGSREAVYWQSKDGAVAADVQPGPRHTVRVTGTHIEIVDRGSDAVIARLNSSGAARWLALRLLEGAVIWEREVHRERTD